MLYTTGAGPGWCDCQPGPREGIRETVTSVRICRPSAENSLCDERPGHLGVFPNALHPDAGDGSGNNKPKNAWLRPHHFLAAMQNMGVGL
jgi:hypothetical protein